MIPAVSGAVRAVAFAAAAFALLLGAAGEVRADATCDTGGGPVAVAEPLEGTTCGGDLVIVAGTTSTLNGAGAITVSGNLTVETGAVLDVLGTPSYAFLDVGGDFTLQTNATINLAGQSGVVQPTGTSGAGGSNGYTCGGGGGGHGGTGGMVADSLSTVLGGNPYGADVLAFYPGSRGGYGTLQTTPVNIGGTGGGALRVVVGGLATLDGLITADGVQGTDTGNIFSEGAGGGGGSGGSIYVRAQDLTTHNPGVHLSVVGGRGGNSNGGGLCGVGAGGAGGRISVYYGGQNGTGTGVALDTATHMSCAGGNPGSNGGVIGATSGGVGSCLLAAAGSPPQLDSVTPAELGQGASNRTLVLAGQGFTAYSDVTIAGAAPGQPNAGITVHSVTVDSSTSITVVVSIAQSADASPGANPKPVQVRNADLSSSPPTPLFTVTPAPVVDHIEQGGTTVTGLPRGFAGQIVIFGSNIQAGASLSFGAGPVTLTGTPAIDVTSQTVTADIQIAEAAAAGPVTFAIVNPDGGTPAVPGTLQVLSQPVIDALAPDTLIVGQTSVPVVLTGSGFIAAAQVLTDAADVTVEQVQFDGFGQLTATVSVAVEADLTSTARNLWVDNGDGGVSPTATLTLAPVPAGVNPADLVYSDGGGLTPPDRVWNGLGWSQPGSATTALPEAPAWVVTRAGLTSGDVVLATVDATRRLHLQERVGGTWGAAIGPIALAAGPGRPVDAAAVAGSGGERFLAVYGASGSAVPTFRMLGGGGATGSLPATGDCAAGTEVLWVRVVSNPAGGEAVAVYAPDNLALCAVTWDGTGFDAATEVVLAPAGALAADATRAFDATYWGTAAPGEAMVAWGRAGSAVPGSAVWDGATWTVRDALSAASGPGQSPVGIRLAASARSNRVALLDVTSIGELYAQFWGGSRWGSTVQELPFALVANPSMVAGAGVTRAFDVAWAAAGDRATVVMGVAGTTTPQTRRWTPTAGWNTATSLPAPGGATELAWVQLRADPGSGSLLSGVLESGGRLTYYGWNGAAWTTGQVLGAAAPTGTEAFMAAYRAAPPPGPPQVTDVTYGGVSPARLGVGATGQTLTVLGGGFLNPPVVSFNHANLQATGVSFVAVDRLLVTVDVGSVPPGAYAVTVQNPDGQSATLGNALTVVAPPAGITTRLGAGAPACTPSAPTATACALQDSASVPVEVLGTGFVAGAQLSFGGAGVTVLSAPTLSVDSGSGLQVLATSVRLAGTATPGVRDVTVTNPDTSAGVGTGVFEVQPRVAVTSVTPAVLGTGAVNATLDVRGTNFQPGVVLGLGSGVSVSAVAWNSPTQVLLTVDVLGVATPGARDVTALNPDGGMATGTGLFAVAPGPAVTAITPALGSQGSTVHVVVDGTELAPLAASGAVSFSGTGLSVSNLTASASQVAFDVTIAPDAAFETARDLILVRDNGGRVTVPRAFTVVPVPVISAVTPSTVTVGELGRAVTLTGQGFHSQAVVQVGTGLTVRSQTVVDATRIDLTLDVGGTPGTVSVAVHNPGGQVSPAASVTVAGALACSAGTGQTVTITPSDPLTCSSLSISGTGRINLVGDLTLHVLGDANVSGGTLFVDPSASYVRLVVDGSLAVAAGAVVQADATGFAGGRLGTAGSGLGGGQPATADFNPATGRGGGYGGQGGDGAVPGGGATYDLLGLCNDPDCFGGMPLDMGSGGGSGWETSAGGVPYWRRGGAGGGSVVLEVAGTTTVDGAVRSNGAPGQIGTENANGQVHPTTALGKGAGGGSGGAVLVLAHGGLAGAGTVQARGGDGSDFTAGFPEWQGTGGGGGRVAVYYGGANTFTGATDCAGGASNNADVDYQGAPGTCTLAAETTIASLTPDSVAQGSAASATLSGSGLVAGDALISPGTGIAWGPLTGTGPFAATLDVDPAAPLGLHDVIVRHADQTGGVVFGALTVVANPRILALSPPRLAQGASGTVQAVGGLLQPATTTVSFLRGGVEPVCGGGACVTAAVDVGASSADALVLNVTVDGAAPIGGYDVRLLQTDGGTALLRNGFTVVSVGGTVPALADVTPAAVGEGVTDAPVTLSGYDFGVPPAFRVDTLATSDANVSLTFDPAGCPAQAAACATDPAGLQHVDALVTTVGAAPGAVDVSVSQSSTGLGSTLVGGLTVTPRPVVTGFTPTSGAATFTLTVSGQNFASGAVVGLADASVQVGTSSVVGADLAADVTVSALAPTASTAVRVTNPDGGSGELGGLVLNPSPVVTSVGPPASLGVGQSATLSVSGANFHPQASVSFGAGITVSNVVFVSAGQLQFTVTVEAGVTPGTRDVTVTNPNGGSGTLTAGFTIKRPVVLSSISANGQSPAVVGAGGTHVLLLAGAEFDANLNTSAITISGSGITKDGLYNFRPIQVGEVTITTVDLVITVASNAAAGPRTLTIRNADGSQSSAGFTVTPAPVVTFADPDAGVLNQLLSVSLNGFNLDSVAPRVCFGTGCDFGAGSTEIDVVSVTPVNSTRVGLSLSIGPSAPLGWQPVTVANSDGGRVTKDNVFQVLADFTVDRIAGYEIPIGGGPDARSLTGTGFTDTPAAPRVDFLLPSGAVDPDITVAATYVSATQIDLSVTVGAGAAPGFRAIRVTNGSGAVAELGDFLLVTHPTGPTVGALAVPDGVGGFVPAVLGLDEAATRVVTGARLTGSGLDGGGLTLAFGRAGISAANVVAAPGGQSATLDLSLAPTTLPGTASLTASTSAGSDTRAGALTVNGAPVLTSLLPASLTPGTSNVSVLIDGGGFQPGARVAVTPAGVTPRDLDTAEPGTQASFLSATALRVVVDVDNLADGTYTLAITNPDGGRGTTGLPVTAPAAGTPAKVTYLRESGGTGLKVRDWPGAPGILAPISSNSAALPHTTVLQDAWTVMRADPMVPGQYILGVGQAQRTVAASGLRVYRTLADGISWEAVDAVGALSSMRSQAFDLAFEHAGPGRALLVYGEGTSLLYKVIDAAGAGGANPVLIGGASPLATGTVQWVRLVPEPGGRRILVLYLTNTRQVQAVVWDGAAPGGGAFVSQFDVGGGPLTTDAVVPETNAGGVVKPGFDGAWEGLTGHAVVFWSVDGTNALWASRWDPVGGWETPAAGGTAYTGTGPTFVEADADPGSDRIAVLAASDNGNLRPLVARMFAGGWVPGSETVLAVNTTQSSGVRRLPWRNFDMGWDDTGNLVALYDRVTTPTTVIYSSLESRRWTPSGGWAAPVDLMVDQTLITAVEVALDPDSGELMAVAAMDPGTTTSLSVRMLRWSGNAWRDNTEIATGAVHWPEFSISGIPYRPYGNAVAVAYREDNVPPAQVTLTQTGSSATTATVQWTAPGDNGTTGQAGGYDIRWSDLTIVDDATVADCDAPPAGQVCFSRATQVRPSPVPRAAGATETVTIDLGAPGVYHVALKTGDRANAVDTATGAETPRRNVSAMSPDLTVTTLAADPVPPEAITDLAAAAGANPESMIALTWTGVGDDGGVSPTGPVLGYDLRMATLPISETGGDDNFHVPFDQATQVAVTAPATDGGGGTRGVANAYTVTGLASGQAYYFAVKGLDEDPTTQAAISNVASLTTQVVVPEAIDDLVVAATDTNTATLTWTARGGAPTSYELRFATFPITAANFFSAIPVGGVPAPAAAGTRQTTIVPGLMPDTSYFIALVPVRYQTVGGVLTRLAPDPAVVLATTQPDPTANPTQPTAVSDLAVVPGTVRDGDARLSWTSPATAGAQAVRYEFRWAHRPLATAAPAEVHVVNVSLLPAPTGTHQEYTVTGLPENALVYVALVSYDRSGLASALSNEVLVHTALRRGMNGMSVPGSLQATDLATVLGPYVGSCTTGTGSPDGAGPVGPCGNGQVTVTAYRWDPAAGATGGFVAMAQTDTLAPGVGLFVQSNGNQAVVDAAGTDLPAFAPLPLAQNAPTLIANPYFLPVAVADLRVQGDDGYDKAFPDAVTDGVIDPTLLFFTRVDGVLQYVTVTAADDLLPYRAYFVQLGALADPAVNYQIEVLHP